AVEKVLDRLQRRGAVLLVGGRRGVAAGGLLGPGGLDVAQHARRVVVPRLHPRRQAGGDLLRLAGELLGAVEVAARQGGAGRRGQRPRVLPCRRVGAGGARGGRAQPLVELRDALLVGVGEVLVDG